MLDAGCGYGRNLVYLLREGCEVFALDANAEGVAHVRALAGELAPQLPPENFRVGAIEAMDFPDAFADVVICSSVLHFARDEQHFLAMVSELWRVLRPGGMLFCRLGSRIGMEFERRAEAYLSHRRRLGVVPGGRGRAAAHDRADERPAGRSAEDHDRAGLPLHDDLGGAETDAKADSREPTLSTPPPKSERLVDMSTATATKVLTDRINRIEVSATMAITAEALKLKAQGIDLADFGAGEPHFATPQHIKDAAIQAIEKNFTRYTAVAGTPEVRKAIVERHAADFGTNYTVEECVFTTGGKLALFNAIQVLVDHGDEVILPVPYWVSLQGHHPVSRAARRCSSRATRQENFRITREDDRGRDHADRRRRSF